VFSLSALLIQGKGWAAKVVCGAWFFVVGLYFGFMLFCS